VDRVAELLVVVRVVREVPRRAGADLLLRNAELRLPEWDE